MLTVDSKVAFHANTVKDPELSTTSRDVVIQGRTHFSLFGHGMLMYAAGVSITLDFYLVHIIIIESAQRIANLIIASLYLQLRS
jgi:hypothetical protein